MSKIYNKVSKSLTMASLILPLSLTLAGCSDWDDHYDGGASGLSTSGKTLWENISENSNLTDFANVLKQNGYDELLAGDENYTVWAPLNGTFNYDSLLSVSSDRAKSQFIQNHIARTTYTASGTIDERIYVLNSKSQEFAGSGTYTINGVGVSTPNVASSNGVLHTLNGYIPFKENIYESLSSSQYAIDSIADHFKKYEVTSLDVSKSTVGPMLNGEQTYLDSVMRQINYLVPDDQANWGYEEYISTEDSNYSMVLPTNTAWIKATNTVKPLYNYISQYKYNTTVPQSSTAANLAQSALTLSVEEPAYLTDSLVKRQIVSNLFFNNNLSYNRPLQTLQTGQTLVADSLVNTMGWIIYSEDAARLFEGAQRDDKSNGMLWVTDSLRFRPWLTWNPKLELEAEFSSYQVGVYQGSTSRATVTTATQNPAVSGRVSNGAYCLVTPSGPTTNPTIIFKLSGVRSAKYNFYVVVVPSNITNASVTANGNEFTCQVGYNTVNGTLLEERITSRTGVTSDPTKVDTVFVGTFEFPACYYGVEEAYPYLRIAGSVRSSQSYDRALRIDKIILVPTELDEYIKEHPDYKYEQDY